MKLDVTLDVFIWHRPGAVLVTSLAREEVSVMGSSLDAALANFERLAARLLRPEPLAFGDPATNLSTRIVRVRLPAHVNGALIELPLQLFAVVITSRGEQEEEELTVLIPQIGLRFVTQSVQEIEALCGEHLRDHYGLDSRIDALSEFLNDVTLEQDASEPSTQSWMGTRQITVRFKHQGQEQEVEALAEQPTLTSVAEPLHLRLNKKDASGAFERKVEVELLVNYLGERFERSVLLVGQAGVGKTAIVHETVGRMIRKEVPEQLRGTQVWQISGGRLMAGMRYLGQWQERVLAMIEEVKEVGAILFAENLIELLDTSGTSQHSQGVPGLLLPHILSGDLVLVTEARPEQLALAMQRHPGFVRALRRLPVEPLDAPHTDAVLERVSFRLGRQHGVRLAEPTRQKILELTTRFKGALALPGPAVDLAERMARTHRKEGVLEEGAQRPVLLPEHAVEAYASKTGMPPALLDPGVNFDIQDVRDFFEDQIFDQPEAVDAMVDLVAVIRAGLNSPRRPLGSFLFLGPTGVGKTQTALSLAQYLFGSKDRLLRFDMSEYQDAWAAGRLVGRYKGEPGEFVKRIREEPFQVVLLDEVEKADGAVFDLLLQALGEGRLTDALGQTVDLTSSVFIMTSNLGASQKSQVGFDQLDDEARRHREATHYLRAVESFFRPEFVGRIDQVIPFRSLGSKTSRKLVERALEQAFAREGLRRRGISVSASAEVVEYLMRVGFDERYGARPLRQAVESRITAALANFISLESDVKALTLAFVMQDGVPVLRRVER